MQSETTTYTPGVCNINVSEIRRRRKIGFIGLVSLLILLAVLFILKLPPFIWATAFIPGFLMATGFLQAKHKFCVGYAAAGMRHTATDAEKITDKNAISLDKQRAKSINLQALAIGIGVAILSVLAAMLAI